MANNPFLSTKGFIHNFILHKVLGFYFKPNYFFIFAMPSIKRKFSHLRRKDWDNFVVHESRNFLLRCRRIKNSFVLVGGKKPV